MRSLFTAATGMEAQQLRIDAIANNLANSTTNGFKKWRPEFHDLFYETLQDPGSETSSGTSRASTSWTSRCTTGRTCSTSTASTGTATDGSPTTS